MPSATASRQYTHASARASQAIPAGGRLSPRSGAPRPSPLRRPIAPSRLRTGPGGVAMSAIQAIIRRQIALAMKGNGPAQRAVIAAVEGIEDELARAAAEQSAWETQTGAEYAHMSDTEAARRIAYLLRLTAAQDPEFRAELAPELRAASQASWADGEAAVLPAENGDGERAR